MLEKAATTDKAEHTWCHTIFHAYCQNNRTETHVCIAPFLHHSRWVECQQKSTCPIIRRGQRTSLSSLTTSAAIWHRISSTQGSPSAGAYYSFCFVFYLSVKMRKLADMQCFQNGTYGKMILLSLSFILLIRIWYFNHLCSFSQTSAHYEHPAIWCLTNDRHMFPCLLHPLLTPACLPPLFLICSSPPDLHHCPSASPCPNPPPPPTSPHHALFDTPPLWLRPLWLKQQVGSWNRWQCWFSCWLTRHERIPGLHENHSGHSVRCEFRYPISRLIN